MRVTPDNGDGGGEAIADAEAGLLKLIHVATRASDEAGILRAAVEGIAAIFDECEPAARRCEQPS